MRRTKSEDCLHLCQRGKEVLSPMEDSSDGANNGMQNQSSFPSTTLHANILPSTTAQQSSNNNKLPMMMNKQQCILSEAVLQWNDLVDTEEKSSPSYLVLDPISNEKRRVICDWCYSMVDSVRIDRRVVSTAIFYFERYRYLHRSDDESKLRSKDVWRCVLACLCLAIKLHSNHSEEYTRKIVMNICLTSRYSVKKIARTELDICKILGWHLNPPVPIHFLEVAEPLLEQITSRFPWDMSSEIIELSRFLLEVSVFHAEIARERPSSVAMSAILVAMNYLTVPSMIANDWLSLNMKQLSCVTNRCIPKLQQILNDNHDQIVNHRYCCSSPKTVGYGLEGFENHIDRKL